MQPLQHETLRLGPQGDQNFITAPHGNITYNSNSKATRKQRYIAYYIAFDQNKTNLNSTV